MVLEALVTGDVGIVAEGEEPEGSKTVVDRDDDDPLAEERGGVDLGGAEEEDAAEEVHHHGEGLVVVARMGKKYFVLLFIERLSQFWFKKNRYLGVENMSTLDEKKKNSGFFCNKH